MYVFSVPTHAFNHCIASRKTWFHHGNKYSAAACSVWQPVDLLGGTTRVGSLCLVFHPASQTPPHQPIKWRIVKETFLECLTHYSLTLSPFPSPWFMQASLPPGCVHDRRSASLLLQAVALNRQSHRCAQPVSLTRLITRRTSDLRFLPLLPLPFKCPQVCNKKKKENKQSGWKFTN